jgi:hypothetical protein
MTTSRLSKPGAISKQPLYATWNGIRQRCLNPNNTGYENWGGRGIQMHEPWVESFWAFAEWVEANLGQRPDGHTLDRYPDVNGNYEPGNLRWATYFEQMANTRAQLDPMNGVQRDHNKNTFYYQIRRDGVLYAEYGFASPDDAAAARDELPQILDNGGDARAHVRQRRETRQAEIETARQAAQAAKDAAVKAREEARMATRMARELAKQDTQARREERLAEHAGRAARYHRLNQTMTLSDIGRKEGVSVAHVSTELKRHGYEAAAMKNSTGFPGVKQVTKGTRTYFEARMVIDGKRKTLGQRNTAEEAYELILAAKDEQTEKPGPQPSQVSDPKPRPRRVQVRAA